MTEASRDRSSTVPTHAELDRELATVERLRRMAVTGTAANWLELPDEEKLLWFALCVDESSRRKKAEDRIEELECELSACISVASGMDGATSYTPRTDKLVTDIGPNNPRAMAIHAVDLARQLERELQAEVCGRDAYIAPLNEKIARLGRELSASKKDADNSIVVWWWTVRLYFWLWRLDYPTRGLWAFAAQDRWDEMRREGFTPREAAEEDATYV